MTALSGLRARGTRPPISIGGVLLVATSLLSCSPGPTAVPASTAPAQGSAPSSGTPIDPSPAASGSAPSGTPSTGAPSAMPSDSSIVGAAIEALDDTDSYRLVVVTTEGRTTERFEVLRINRPRIAWSAGVESTGGVERVIVIDARAWIDRGTGRFVASSVSEAEELVGIPAIDGIVASYRDPALAGALRFVGREAHGGAPADHYRATPDALRAVRPNVGDTAMLDVWIAPDGPLVAISSVGLPGPTDGVQMDITDVDDPANVVEPPR